MPYCNALKLRVLDALFGDTAFTKDTTLYIGLATTSVDASGTVTGEPSGANAYARQSFTNNNTSFWTAATGTGSKTNGGASGQVTFPTCTTGNWGTITKFFIANHLTNTGSAILLYGDISPSITVNIGDQAIINASQLTVTLT